MVPCLEGLVDSVRMRRFSDVLNKLRHRKRIRPSIGEANTPPGQFVTSKWPVMTFGDAPGVRSDEWELHVFGLVENEVRLDWDQLNKLPREVVESPFHCVTQWSRMHNRWEGVGTSFVLELARPKPVARHIMVHCYGGYTTNLPTASLMERGVLLALRHDDALLEPDHGGPVRLVVPMLYGWKSAKWVRGLELMADDHPGFWERNGYHMRGDPWKEERFQ